MRVMLRAGPLFLLAAALAGCSQDTGDHPPRASTPAPAKTIAGDSQYVLTVQGMT